MSRKTPASRPEGPLRYPRKSSSGDDCTTGGLNQEQVSSDSGRTVGVPGPITNHPSDFDRLRNCLAEVLQGYQELENSLLGFFEHCEQWAKELFARQATRRQTRCAAPPQPPLPSPEVQRQDTLLAEQIEHLREQSTVLGETISELHQLRTHLTSWVAETLLLAQGLPDKSQKERISENRLFEHILGLQKERDALEAQRRQLEAILADKTQQAAQLAELVEQQKRQMARQQEQWVKQLQILKPLVDSLFGHLVEFPLHEAQTPPANEASEIHPDDAEDIVRLPPLRGPRSSTG